MKYSISLLTAALPLALALTVSPLLHGQSVAAYTFDKGRSNSVDSDRNSTASMFHVNTVANIFDSAVSGSTRTAFVYSDFTPNTEAAVVSSSKYFSFTVVPEAGFSLNLKELQFDTNYNGYVEDAAVYAYYVVRSSVDNYSTNLASFTEGFQSVPQASNAEDWTFTKRIIDLSDSSFQNIARPIEFRLYLYDNSTSHERVVRVDNVILKGSTTKVGIPEPAASGALFALFALSGVLLIKRRSKAELQ